MDVNETFDGLRRRMRQNDPLETVPRDELARELARVMGEDVEPFQSADRWRVLTWLLGRHQFEAVFTYGDEGECQVRVPVWWVHDGDTTDDGFYWPVLRPIIGGIHREEVNSGGDMPYAELAEHCRLESIREFVDDLSEQQHDDYAAQWEQQYLR